MDLLDILIAQTLRARWGNCRPPDRVWRRIRRRVVTYMGHTSPIWEEDRRGDGNRMALEPQWLSPFPAMGPLLLWRYDLMVLRFA